MRYYTMVDTNNNPTRYDERSDKYTELLNNFTDSTNTSHKAKNILKIIFFIIIMLIMLLLTAIFIYALFNTCHIMNTKSNTTVSSISEITGAVAALISSLSAVLVSLFKLPEIIAKYLFNRKEDTDMVSLIEKIQKYDTDMFELEHNAEYAFIKNKQNFAHTQGDETLESEDYIDMSETS